MISVQGQPESAVESNAHRLVNVCGQLRSNERALIIADATTQGVGDLLLRYAQAVTPNACLMTVASRSMHGMEPPDDIARAMRDADVIFGVTKSSMAHTTARVNATDGGARYLSLADYSLEQLARPSLTVDFFHWGKVAKRLKDLFDAAASIRVKTKRGTDVTVYCGGRKANFCPGFCANPGSMSSPPDIETNISPLETESEGVIIADGSIPCEAIGLLVEPITLVVAHGSIASIDQRKRQGRILSALFDAYPPNARVLAEFGVGLNPKAELRGFMLEDEGCLGTIHFGFGSNATVGGINAVPFHLDVVVCAPTVWVDTECIMNGGKLVEGFGGNTA